MTDKQHIEKPVAAMTEKPNRIPLLATGIAGFDQILGGGLPEGSLYLIQGLAGSGKTTLACQIGFMQAARGKKVMLLTLIAESHAKMLNHVSNFDFFDESLVGNQLIMFSAYNSLANEGLRGLLKLITAALSEHRPGVLIVDGFRSVRDSGPSDLNLSEFMHALNSLVFTMNCTTLLLSPVEGNIPESENTLVDGLIELSQYEHGMQLIREIKVFKIRGANHMLGKHVFEINQNGIEIFPRFEAVATRQNKVPGTSGEYVSVGIPSWDTCIGGGVVSGSVTCLLGSPGVGKTLMGLHFIEQGLKDRQKCLIVGFYESPERLTAKAKKAGMNIDAGLAGGDLEMIWQLPLETLGDDLAKRLLDNIARRGVTRLLIDGVEGMRNIVMQPGRNRSFLVALTNELRARGVTSMFTEQLPYFRESRPSADPSSSQLYENVMLLEYVARDEVNQRQISVMKLRENGYDGANRVMNISDNGISINGPVTIIRSSRGDDGQ
ncbi:ATPase domain-containing protein [Herbaspirillum lusitanum]|jgi:circadian clock protein KaiC|uniref:non-specific serine/threonine protein kinase n=1 Tax=Herbaspirillum lusitanum TaxID=213312 RepID=A0ABW9A8J1_9BURK